MVTDTPTPLVTWFERHVSVRLPFTRFARNMVLLSLIGLAPVLALYVALTPGFWSQLMTADAALARFLRQILTNGLPVVFAVNTVSVILFSRSRIRNVGAGTALVLDFLSRTVFFAALHAVIFFASALMFGSFGGHPLQALHVVGPTLAQAAAFGNFSGVYLYATLISALPLHMALAETWRHRRGYRPASGAILALVALAVIAAQILVLTAGAVAVSHLL